LFDQIAAWSACIILLIYRTDLKSERKKADNCTRSFNLVYGFDQDSMVLLEEDAMALALCGQFSRLDVTCPKLNTRMPDFHLDASIQRSHPLHLFFDAAWADLPLQFVQM
jgi:hypothetical protein